MPMDIFREFKKRSLENVVKDNEEHKRIMAAEGIRAAMNNGDVNIIQCECCNLEWIADRFDMQKLWTIRFVGKKKYYFCPRCKKHMLERIRSHENVKS